MAIKLSSVIILTSIICAFFTGNISELGTAAVSGADKAVKTAFSLMSVMCLWGGIMKVFEAGGVLRLFTKLFRPILRFIFPESSKNEAALSKIGASLCANILGIGNASTPLALSALKEMKRDKSEAASTDIKTFTLIGCAPPCFFPTTVVALRSAMGSSSPADTVIPVWAVSGILFFISIFLSKLLGKE